MSNNFQSRKQILTLRGVYPSIISKVGGRWDTSKQWAKNNVGTGMLHKKISSPTHGRQSQWSGRQFFSTILSSPSHLDWNHVN